MTNIIDIDFTIKQHGTGILQIYVNDNKPTFTFSDGSMHFGQIKEVNNLKIIFNKDDPSDTSSYAVIKDVSINNTDFTEFFKTLNYTVDQTQHPKTEKTIKNNCYFGYIGELTWEFTNNIIDVQAKESYNKKLTNNKELSLYEWTKNDKNYTPEDFIHYASWLIAKKEHEESIAYDPRLHLDKPNSYDEIKNRARLMYTGVYAPRDPAIEKLISSLTVEELRKQIDVNDFSITIKRWFEKSKLISILGVDTLQNLTFGNGVSDFIFSLINKSKKRFGILDNTYYYNFDMLDSKKSTIFDVVHPLECQEGETVLIEYPSPHYSTDELNDIIKKCISNKCYLAIDLTLLPITNQSIEIDLTPFNEIYFSMNKALPIDDLRSAIRFSKTKIHDHYSIMQQQRYYNRIGANLFLNFINNFDLDYVYNKHNGNIDDINITFNLTKTNLLWLSKSSEYKNPIDHMPSKHYNFNKLISISRLIENKDKFFW